MECDSHVEPRVGVASDENKVHDGLLETKLQYIKCTSEVIEEYPGRREKNLSKNPLTLTW